MSFLLRQYGLSGAYMLWSGIVFHLTAVGLLLRPSPAERLSKLEKLNRGKISETLSGRPEKMSMLSGINSLFASVNQSVGSGMEKIGRRSGNSKAALVTKSSQGDTDLTLLKTVLNKEMSRSNSVCTNRSSVHRPPSPTVHTTSRNHLSVKDVQAQSLFSPNTPVSPTHHVAGSLPSINPHKDFNSSNVLNTSNITVHSRQSSFASSFYNSNGFINNGMDYIDMNQSHTNGVVNHRGSIGVSTDNVNSNWYPGHNSRLQSASQFVSSR